MSDLLRNGLTWLERQRAAHMASPVLYRRAGQADTAVPATFGKTDYEVADDYGARIRTHGMDFLIRADALGFAPQAGDAIVADGRNYEVMGLAGDDVWRWSDPYRTTYRIHTKDIGAEK